MFEALSDQLRSARAPLTYGYSVLLAIWIGFDGRAPGWLRSDAASDSLTKLIRDLSAGARFAAGAVFAFAIGIVLEHSLLGKFTEWLDHRIAGATWIRYIREAEGRATTYGEDGRGFTWYELRDNKGPDPRVSSGKEAALWAEVENRRAEAASFRYRFAVLLSAVPVFASLIVAGSKLWIALVLVFLAILLELKYFDRLVTDNLAAIEIQAKTLELKVAEDQSATLEKRSPQEGPISRPIPDEVRSAKARAEKLRSDLAMLESNPRGYFRRQDREED